MVVRRVEVTRSKQQGKKFEARFLDGGPSISFGQSGASDYTRNKDASRKKAYIARHKKNEDWDDQESAGFWSRYLLWEKPTIRGAAKALRSKGLDVHLNV